MNSNSINDDPSYSENQKFIVDIKKLGKNFIENFDLNENEDFEIENNYKISKEIIEICLYNYEEKKYELAKEKDIENIITFMYHYKMDKEIEEILDICLNNERILVFNDKLEKNFQYNLKLKAIKNPKIACDYNFLDCLKKSHEKGTNFNNRFDLIRLCASKGHLELLKYFKEKIGIKFENINVEIQNEYERSISFRYGDYFDFKLRDYSMFFLKFTTWTKRFATEFSALNGHLDCLKYLYENGCPWDERAIENSALNGHLECLKYLFENGCSVNNENAIANAALNGHLDCIKYLHKKGCLWNYSATVNAAQNGHLDCLKYIHENGCPLPLNSKAIENSALNGHLNCLKYLHEKGCFFNKTTIAKAALNGHLDCLKFLRNIGCPFDENAIEFSARNGNLECLKYLHEIGYSCSIKTYIRANKSKNLEIVQFLKENKCPIPQENYKYGILK